MTLSCSGGLVKRSWNWMNSLLIQVRIVYNSTQGQIRGIWTKNWEPCLDGDRHQSQHLQLVLNGEHGHPSNISYDLLRKKVGRFYLDEFVNHNGRSLLTFWYSKPLINDNTTKLFSIFSLCEIIFWITLSVVESMKTSEYTGPIRGRAKNRFRRRRVKG